MSPIFPSARRGVRPARVVLERALRGKRGAVAFLALLPLAIAGCGGGSDNATLPPPRSNPGSVAAGHGPAVSVSGAAPQLAGQPAADAILRRDAAVLPPGCKPATERDDPKLASFIWVCPHKRVYAATIELGNGRQAKLGDLLTGSYVSYLSSIARTQFQADGVANPSVSDLGTWYLTPAALVVVFPSGPVSFPVSSLTPYLKDPALLG